MIVSKKLSQNNYRNPLDLIKCQNILNFTPLPFWHFLKWFTKDTKFENFTEITLGVSQNNINNRNSLIKY